MNPRPLHLRPAWLAIGWVLVVAVGVLSLVPKLPASGINHIDKAGHFVAYFALMSWFGFVYLRSAHLLIAVLLVVLGVALEGAQWHFGHRQFEVVDAAANVLGITAGWMLAGTRFATLLESVERRIGVV